VGCPSISLSQPSLPRIPLWWFLCGIPFLPLSGCSSPSLRSFLSLRSLHFVHLWLYSFSPATLIGLGNGRLGQGDVRHGGVVREAKEWREGGRATDSVGGTEMVGKPQDSVVRSKSPTDIRSDTAICVSNALVFTNSGNH